MAYIADQFGDNNQTVLPSTDGTIGLLPSYTIWNLMVDYSIRRERLQIQPYFLVKNLTDELYIASRAPQGIQPGLFRQANAGVKFTF
jgi:Fe(3+) dicitrate transport protein